MSMNSVKPARKEGLQITERDKKIVHGCYRFRVMTTDQIERLTGSTSRPKLNRRTRELWGNDILDRNLELEKILYSHAEKRHTLHFLGKEGARLLSALYGIRFPKWVDWKVKNKVLKGVGFIEHAISLTDTVLQAESDINQVEGLRVIDRHEIWQTSPAYNSNVKDPFSLRTVLHWPDGKGVKKVRRNTKPDYTLAIGDTRGAKPQRGLLFLEEDLNTEDYARSDALQSSILQKFLGYTDAYNRELVKKMYGYGYFRVLFVVAAEQRRVERMIATYQAHKSRLMPPGGFVFVTKQQLENEGFLAPIWQTADRKTISLISAQKDLDRQGQVRPQSMSRGRRASSVPSRKR